MLLIFYKFVSMILSFVHVQDSKAGTPKKSPPGSGKGSAKKPASPKGGRGTPSKSAGKPAVKGTPHKGMSFNLLVFLIILFKINQALS